MAERLLIPYIRQSRAKELTISLDDQPAERDLALLVPVAIRPALRHVFAPRADDLTHLLLHQLGEDAEADADRERQQPLLGRAGDLVEGDLDTLGQVEPAPVDGVDDLETM